MTIDINKRANRLNFQDKKSFNSNKLYADFPLLEHILQYSGIDFTKNERCGKSHILSPCPYCKEWIGIGFLWTEKYVIVLKEGEYYERVHSP